MEQDETRQTSSDAKHFEYRGDLAETPLTEILARISRFAVPGVLKAVRDEVWTEIYIRDGDVITIDAETQRLDVAVSDEEMAARRNDWQMPAYKAQRGTLYKYIKNVKTASEGCVTDE